MIYPDLAIQTAIYDALIADSALMDKISGVFDSVPREQAFPYITIGASTLADFGSHTFDGADTTFTIHTWARSAGRKNCKEIMADIYRILHNGTLSLSGYSIVSLRHEFGETVNDPDGQTYHGIQRFRILLGGD